MELKLGKVRKLSSIPALLMPSILLATPFPVKPTTSAMDSLLNLEFLESSDRIFTSNSSISRSQVGRGFLP